MLIAIERTGQAVSNCRQRRREESLPSQVLRVDENVESSLSLLVFQPRRVLIVRHVLLGSGRREHGYPTSHLHVDLPRRQLS